MSFRTVTVTFFVPSPQLTLGLMIRRPRDGRSVNFLQVYMAIIWAGGCSPDTAFVVTFGPIMDFMVLRPPSCRKVFFNLSDFGEHDVIEHDASLTRADHDVSEPGSGLVTDVGLVQEMIDLADEGGYIWIDDFAKIRVERQQRSLERRGFPLTHRQKLLGTGELALLLAFFGVDKEGRGGKLGGMRVKIHRDDLKAVSEDHIPAGWEQPGWWNTNVLSLARLWRETTRATREAERESQIRSKTK